MELSRHSVPQLATALYVTRPTWSHVHLGLRTLEKRLGNLDLRPLVSLQK